MERLYEAYDPKDLYDEVHELQELLTLADQLADAVLKGKGYVNAAKEYIKAKEARA